MSIVFVHGSVETPATPLYQEVLNVAAAAGNQAMAGGDHLKSIEEALKVLEACPLFNAGYGSCLTRDGQVELDASIMDGPTGRFGAVGAMGSVVPAISVARQVMEQSRHVLLVGEGATRFALERGFQETDLVADEQRESWLLARKLAADGVPPESFSLYTGLPHEPGDTTGCVVCTDDGVVAAGSSTGGAFYKLPGRVGDTPICGAGIFASAGAAIVCTGLGEAFIRTVMAKRVEQMICRDGLSPQEATEEAVRALYRETGATGGLLAVDAKGRIGAAHNCATFPVGLFVDGQQVDLIPVRLAL
jgi:L-asparaginase / beta-aspartyl-peptidase